MAIILCSINFLSALFIFILSDLDIILSLTFIVYALSAWIFLLLFNARYLVVVYFILNSLFLSFLLFNATDILTWSTSPFHTDDSLLFQSLSESSVQPRFYFGASGVSFVILRSLFDNIFTYPHSLLYLNQIFLLISAIFSQKIIQDLGFQRSRLIPVALMTNPAILYFSFFHLKEIFIILNLILFVFFVNKFYLFNNFCSFLSALFFASVLISDRLVYFPIIASFFIISQIFSVFLTSRFRFFALLIVIPFFVFLSFKGLPNIAYYLSLFKSSNVNPLISPIYSVLTPLPWNFYQTGSLPNTIDFLKAASLPFNLILFLATLFRFLSSPYFSRFLRFKNTGFPSLIFIISLMFISFIFFSFYNPHLLRMKLAYLALAPISFTLCLSRRTCCH